MTFAELQKLAAKKEAFIDKSLKDLQTDVAKLQRKMYDELIDKLLPQLKTENGRLVRTSENFAIINRQLDELNKNFAAQFTTPMIKKFAEKMLKTFEMTDDFYMAGYNVSARAFDAMQEQSKWIYERVGITKQGGIITGGYLDKLKDMPEVQTKVRNYIVSNVTSTAGLQDFQKGMKEIIQGTKEVPGAVTRYFNQYTSDIYNQADSAMNNVYAEAMELEYFVYFGTIMEDSRCFCIKRAGRVFHKSDADNWINDKSLIKGYRDGKYPYSPLIDRGGFNCRHSIAYISKQMAEYKGYNKADAAAVVSAPCPDDSK